MPNHHFALNNTQDLREDLRARVDESKTRVDESKPKVLAYLALFCVAFRNLRGIHPRRADGVQYERTVRESRRYHDPKGRCGPRSTLSRTRPAVGGPAASYRMDPLRRPGGEKESPHYDCHAH